MLSIIVAMSENNAIGKGNDLIYHLPDDMKRFKRLTTGHTIIMGRNTYMSLPKRPLPKRRNIVLSRWMKAEDNPGAEICRSVSKVLEAVKGEEEAFVIGGAQLYKNMMPYADTMYLTLIHDITADADVFFPEINPDEWEETAREFHPQDEKHAYSFTFIDYKRKRADSQQ